MAKKQKMKSATRDPDDVSSLCIDTDFTPEAIKQFYNEMFSKSPRLALREPEDLRSACPTKKPIFEMKDEMNPYFLDVFKLVDENESALRDDRSNHPDYAEASSSGSNRPPDC